MRRLLILLGLTLGLAIAVSPALSADPWRFLQTDGMVVLLRHTLAPGTGDPANFRLGDCRTQRNLSDEGRSQARQLGEAFRRRQVKVAQVLSSQWCRCRETAQLMNIGTVQPEPILNSFFSDRRTADQQTRELRRLIQAHRQRQGVLVMVTHQVNITALTGIVPRSGAGVIVRANAQGEIAIVAEIALD